LRSVRAKTLASRAALRAMVNCTGVADVETCEVTKHVSERLQVIICLVIVLLIGLGLYLVHLRWRQRESQCAKAVGTLNEASGLATLLVRHFSPSMRVAKYQFRGMSAPKATIDISFRDLGLVLHNGAKVLAGVTGEFKAGRMCAIMGPSGAGKTTFMNVLCGKATYGKMSGTALFNGHAIDIHQISSVVGFVPQDDIVHETLTVREQIRYSALLRNKANTSADRVERITDDVLNVMQIDHIQNSIVGSVEKRGISGGQRKRVNIGLELAAQPTVLFLDEPTSGLDSTSSLAVVYSLKKMTQLGMSCIMVIHQPRYSLFTLFDDVLLLGKGGHAVYLGGSLGAKAYFQGMGFEIPDGENLADWFMDVISGEVPNPRVQGFQPKMLFDWWEAYEKGEMGVGGANVQEGEDTARHREMGGRAAMTEQEDAMVLRSNLIDEWNRIDDNHDGFLDADELKTLLKRCSNLEPEDEVVGELMARMAGKDHGVVTRNEFLKYLLSLKSTIAQETSNSPSRNSPKGLDFTIRGLPATMAALAKPALFIGRRRSDAYDEDDEDSEATSSDESDGDSDEHGFTGKNTMLRKLHRKTPGLCAQMNISGQRNAIQWWRKNPSRMIFFAAMTIGAVILSLQDVIVKSPLWDAMVYVNTHTIVGLLIAIFCLQVFGENQPVFWRERNRGLNVLAHTVAKDTLTNIDILMQCFLFTSVYYCVRGYQVAFFWYFIPYLLVGWTSAGWAFLVSAWVPYTHGPFVTSLVVFVVCGLLGNPFNLSKFLGNPALEAGVSLISITRWSIPMSFWLYVDENNIQPPTEGKDKAIFQQYQTSLSKGTWQDALGGYWWAGLYMLVAQGFVLRVVTFIGLLVRNRDKQV